MLPYTTTMLTKHHNTDNQQCDIWSLVPLVVYTGHHVFVTSHHYHMMPSKHPIVTIRKRQQHWYMFYVQIARAPHHNHQSVVVDIQHHMMSNNQTTHSMAYCNNNAVYYTQHPGLHPWHRNNQFVNDVSNRHCTRQVHQFAHHYTGTTLTTVHSKVLGHIGDFLLEQGHCMSGHVSVN